MGMVYRRAFVAAMGLVLLSGCMRGDPAERFIVFMDGQPPEERVPNWEQTKALMMRAAPAVGEAAPDFTLPTLDGENSFTLSDNRGHRPAVLILASYT